jgi:uncharacterized membrane protein
MLQLVLRFSHVFFGALWVGMMVFGTFFMGPAVEEAGPDGGKVMAGLIRRKVMILMPLFALITLVSGFWLFSRLGGGNMSALMATGMGKAFGFGGVMALLAFIFGMAIARPTMLRAQQLSQSGGSPAEVQILRARANTLGRVVGVLLLLALAAMAVARYV